MKSTWAHYLFYNQENAEDFFENTRAEYLIHLERYMLYTDWEIFSATRKEPNVGYNIPPLELDYAKTYKNFLGYERATAPFELFGPYKVLGEQKFNFVKKFFPIKLSKHS